MYTVYMYCLYMLTKLLLIDTSIFVQYLTVHIADINTDTCGLSRCPNFQAFTLTGSTLQGRSKISARAAMPVALFESKENLLIVICVLTLLIPYFSGSFTVVLRLASLFENLE